MKSATCDVCGQEFSRRDNMVRHWKNKHAENVRQTQPTFTSYQQPLSREKDHDRQLKESNAQLSSAETPNTSLDWNTQYHQQQSPTEEPYFIYPTNDPYTFKVPSGYDPDHFMPWAHPFTSVIAGPTGSGKSMFVRRFVHNIKHMMMPIPDRILWCYGEYQTLYGTVEGVEFQQGLPDLDALDSGEKHLIIVDDLMDETDQRIASLFTKKSHHRNISVMYIVQNLFHQGKYHRTISLNAHYMVVFKNPRDVSQIMALAQQMYPKRTKFFLEAYAAATARPHGYLLIDMKQDTPDILRLRHQIFPGEQQQAAVDI